MKGLKVVRYYRKILNKYTLEQAMKDSLCFVSNSKESEALVEIAEDTTKNMIHTLLHNRQLLSFYKVSNFDYLLFVKMLADVINNIEKIKIYLSKYSNALENHRKMIFVGIVNMDFLREGNFIKINRNYYNLEIAAYIITHKEKDYQSLYDYFITATFHIGNSSNEENYRKSIYNTFLQWISESLPMYEKLSVTKKENETIKLMCMNTNHSEIITKLCIKWGKALKKGFKYYFPMNYLYKDGLWIETQIMKVNYKILDSERKGLFSQLKPMHQLNDLEKVGSIEFGYANESIKSDELMSVNMMYMQNIRL